jgi:hypothetical protein
VRVCAWFVAAHRLFSSSPASNMSRNVGSSRAAADNTGTAMYTMKLICRNTHTYPRRVTGRNGDGYDDGTWWDDGAWRDDAPDTLRCRDCFGP